MTAAHPSPDRVKVDAVRLYGEIGWLDGTLIALRLDGVEVSRSQLRRWLEGAGVDVRVERLTGGRAARAGEGRLLTQLEFNRAHEAYPVPRVEQIRGWAS